MVTCRRRCCCCFRWSLDHRKKCLKLCECVCPPHIDLHTVRHLFAFATALLLLPLFSCLSCDIERAIFDGHRQIVSGQIHFHYSQLFDNNKQRRLHKKQRLSESVGERERERESLFLLAPAFLVQPKMNSKGRKEKCWRQANSSDHQSMVVVKCQSTLVTLSLATKKERWGTFINHTWPR